MARSQPQVAVVPAAAHGSGGGSNVWRALSPFVWIAAILVLVVLSIKFGVGAVMDFVDPGGAGQPIMAWPLDNARAPHVVRNLGALTFLAGFLPALIHHRVRDIGIAWLGWGALAFVVGILAAPTADWMQVAVPHWWSVLLNHPGDLWSQLGGS